MIRTKKQEAQHTIQKVIAIILWAITILQPLSIANAEDARSQAVNIGDTATGTVWVGNSWMAGTQSYFDVSDFTGALAGAQPVGFMECIDHTAAEPNHVTGSYYAQVTNVNQMAGYIEYYVIITPPGVTDGVSVDAGGLLYGYQRIGGTVRVPRSFGGAIELRKSCANPAITNDNPIYSLAGAVYGIYDGDNNLIKTVTTDGNGQATFADIMTGQYQIREITPPAGFALDGNAYSVTVNAGQTGVLEVTDIPQSNPVSVLLSKADSETNANQPQGQGSFADAEFTIRFFAGYYDDNPEQQGAAALKTWVIKTDQNGQAILSASSLVSGDSFYYNSAGDIVLPLGTITIHETKAPSGYLINDTTFVTRISASGMSESVLTYNAPTIPEDIIRGDVQIVKYGESNGDKNDSGADIKRPLEGVNFHLTSNTTGSTYTIVTDKNGYANTTLLGVSERGSLPFDTYTVTEESPYPEFDIVQPFQVTVSEEGQTLYYILRNDSIDAPILIQKTDADTGKVIPIAGTSFQILDQNHQVISMITSYYPSTATTDTFETNENGMLMLPEKLEFGNYYLREVNAPYGYLLGAELPFTVDQEMQWEEPLIITYANKPALGKILIYKTDENTSQPIIGAVFEIRAKEDIVTGDGTIRVNAGEAADTITTNAAGEAQSKELFLGSYEVKEVQTPSGYLNTERVYDLELKYADQVTPVVTANLNVTNRTNKFILTKLRAGEGTVLPGVKFHVWNREVADEITEYTTDENGQIILEYLAAGTYCIQEIEALPGYLPNETVYEFVVDENGYVDGQEAGWLIVENEFARIIRTTAIDKESGTNLAADKQTVTIMDTVEYVNLIAGQEYVMKGILMDKETGEPLLISGQEITTEVLFAPAEKDGAVEIEFALDTSSLSGKEVVVFEKLFVDGEIIASHEDINAVSQTVRFPGEKPAIAKTSTVPKTGDIKDDFWLSLFVFSSLTVITVIFMRLKSKGKRRNSR